MKGIIKALFFIFALSFFQYANSSAIENVSSGVAWVDYEVTFCPAHKDELWDCKVWKFKDNSWEALLDLYGNWMTDLSWRIELLQHNMPFEIRGEWRVEVKLITRDFAWNVWIQNLVYNIDKTAPKLSDNILVDSQNSPYLDFADYDLSENYEVSINHSSSYASSGYDLPNVSSYENVEKWDRVVAFDSVKKLNFKLDNIDVEPFFDFDFTSSSDSYNSNLLYSSWFDKVEIFKWESDSPLLTSNNQIFSLKTKDLGLSWESWEYFRYKLYDKVWNFSQWVFYAYRDETTPDIVDPITDFVIDFPNWEDISSFDAWISKFIPATNNLSFNYHFWDNDDMASWIKMLIESDENDWAFQEKEMLNTVYWDSLQGTLSWIEVTKVDIDLSWESEGRNYRNYSVSFKTPWIDWNFLCDNAWNCVPWDDILKTLRVISWSVNYGNSDISLSLKDDTNGKVFAWKWDKYSFDIALKDTFWNSIRKVYDSSWNLIKDIDFSLWIENTLAVNSYIPWLNSNNSSLVNLSWQEASLSLDKIILNEEKESSNWEFSFDISSKVPTKKWYDFVAWEAWFSINNADVNVVFPDSNMIYNASTSNTSKDFWDEEYITIETWNYTENPQNKYNFESDASFENSYWNVVISLSDNAKISDLNKKINLEFASPVFYTADNFNVLRDGIFSSHTKKTDNKWWISNYEIYEMYLAFDESGQMWWATQADFVVKKSTTEPNFMINSWTALISEADDRFGWVALWISKTDLESGQEVPMKYNAKPWTNFNKWWYTSYISYTDEDSSDRVFIQSISRWIEIPDVLIPPILPPVVTPNNPGWDWNPTPIPPYTWNPWEHFPPFRHWWQVQVQSLTQDVSITWLIAKWEWITTDFLNQEWLVSLQTDVQTWRSETLRQINENIFNYNALWKWCTWSSNYNMSTWWQYSDCTLDIQWEKVTFFDWNTTITSSPIIDEKRAIVVKNWRLTINTNLSTFGTDWQIFLASISENWVENVNIKNQYWDISVQKWWISIWENVTNIDAYMVASGPLVSSNSAWQVLVDTVNQDNYSLLNQLHIYWWVFALNTIWWARATNFECPYLEENCDEISAKVYDLSFARRFFLVDSVSYWWWARQFVPYHPDLDFTSDTYSWSISSWWIVYSSWWDRYLQNGDLFDQINPQVRTSRSFDHEKSPVIIEKNDDFSRNQSVMLKK